MHKTRNLRTEHPREPRVGYGAVRERTPARDKPRWLTLTLSALVIAGLVAVVIWFLRFDRANTISALIQHTGPLGILVGVILMAVLSVLPVPTEFIMIIIMKVFGPWWGILYCWVGTMISATITFLLARHYGRRLLRVFISERRVRKVSHWIEDRGVMGLILARIVPLPFVVVNYTAGISKGVKTWNYIWTSAVGGIPYYAGSALVFLGISQRTRTWLWVGGVAMVTIWIGGYLYNKRLERSRHEAMS